MGCCGGSGGTIIQPSRASIYLGGGVYMADDQKTVVMEYTGQNVGNMTLSIIRGVNLERPYTVGNNETNRFFEATEGDAKILTEAGVAKEVKNAATAEDAEATDDQKKQDNETDAGQAWLERFGLKRPQVEAAMAAGFDTTDKLRTAKDEDLLAIDGWGPATIQQVRATIGKP